MIELHVLHFCESKERDFVQSRHFETLLEAYETAVSHLHHAVSLQIPDFRTLPWTAGLSLGQVLLFRKVHNHTPVE